MKIYISGSLAYDRIMDFPGRFADHILPDKIHVLNVCFTVNGMSEQFGGTAGNIAYNLSLLNESAVVLASVGRDFDAYESWMMRHRLPLEGIRRIEDEFTAGAYITTDLSDNQITGFNPGAMRHPSRYRFEGQTAQDALAIVSPGNVEDMLAYSREYKQRQIPYIFDPGQQIPILTPEQIIEMVTGSRILIVNDYELQLIEKATQSDPAGLLQRTDTLVVTLGDKGSRIIRNDQKTQVDAAEAARVVDPTGAGDAFRAGLLKGIAGGLDLQAACQLGATVASFAVERHGTQAHRFTMDELVARHRRCFGELPVIESDTNESMSQ